MKPESEQTREQPFTPPAESTVGPWALVALLMLVALAAYATFAWQIPPAPVPTPKAAQIRESTVSSAPPPPAALQEATPELTVFKCTSNGRTSYGDERSCPPWATVTPVRIHRELNLSAAVQPGLTHARENEPAPAQQATNPSAEAQIAKARCAALEERAKGLDAAARQPQQPQTLDWIAGEKRDVRTEQYRLKC